MLLESFIVTSQRGSKNQPDCPEAPVVRGAWRERTTTTVSTNDDKGNPRLRGPRPLEEAFGIEGAS